MLFFSASKEKGNAPESCKTHQGEDYSAYNRVGAAENPGDNIKLKKTDTAPVESTDDREKQ